VRSPIKDPGPSFQATLTELKKIIPEEADVATMLFFGGNVEFNLAEANRNVLAHTTRYVIYEFWQHMREDCARIAEMVQFMYARAEKDKKLFAIFQKEWLDYKDPYMRAAMFFMLNRCSTTGYLSSGEFEPEGVNALSLSYLKSFSPINFNIAWSPIEDFVESLQEQKIRGDYVLIPAGPFNYNFFEEGKNKGIEETTIQHKELNSRFKTFDKKSIILYKHHPALLKMYKDFNIRMIDKNGRPTRHTEFCEDLIIANF